MLCMEQGGGGPSFLVCDKGIRVLDVANFLGKVADLTRNSEKILELSYLYRRCMVLYVEYWIQRV